MTHLSKGQFAAIVAAILLFIGIGYHHNSTTTPQYASLDAKTSIEGAVTHADFLADVEQRIESKRQAQKEEEALQKKQKAKRESVECQFWSQQTPRDDNRQQIADKIQQHCEL
jgi:hypothetical protein